MKKLPRSSIQFPWEFALQQQAQRTEVAPAFLQHKCICRKKAAVIKSSMYVTNVMIYLELFLKVHIQLTFYHAVIEFSALMCLCTEELLKLLMRGDDIALSTAALAEYLAHFTVDVFSFPELQKSFTVRGVAYYNRI